MCNSRRSAAASSALRSDGVRGEIAVSHHTAYDLSELYAVPREKVEVIYEGIDQRFQPVTPAEKEAVRQRYSPARPYLLMVGTLEPRKNHRLALDAFAQLKALGYPHRLLIAGGKGWLFEPISALVASMGLSHDVTFAGYVPDDDLPALYSAAEALLMPSLYEGFGFPLLEAMACGTPVIAFRRGSVPELITDGVTGFIAETPQEMQRHAMQLLHDREMARTLGANGARFIARNFSPDRFRVEFAKAIQEARKKWARQRRVRS